MAATSTYKPTNAVAKWIEVRLPIFGFVHSSFVAFPTPRNLNYWWNFGAILTFMLVAQIVTDELVVVVTQGDDQLGIEILAIRPTSGQMVAVLSRFTANRARLGHRRTTRSFSSLKRRVALAP